MEWCKRGGGLQFVGIEAVAGNSAVLQHARRTDMNVKTLSPLGLDKLVRATPAMVFCEENRLLVPEEGSTRWDKDFVTELVQFTGDPDNDPHDDQVDTLSYSVECLKRYGRDTAAPVAGRRRAQ